MTSYKAFVIKISEVLAQKVSIVKWNRMENSSVCEYMGLNTHLKEPCNIQGEKKLLSIWGWGNWVILYIEKKI